MCLLSMAFIGHIAYAKLEPIQQKLKLPFPKSLEHDKIGQYQKHGVNIVLYLMH